jgi:hypothetical protein
MSNPSRVFVLVEDERHKALILRYLVECGLQQHEMRIQLSPSGRGSAENWVLKKFALETRTYRSRQARAESALVVMIDADTRSVQDRWNQLDQALKDNGEPSVSRGERIARLVPKRNVEAWILCLNERDVNESANYSEAREDWNKLIPHAAETLSHWTRPNAEPPNHCIDSLRVGVRELKPLRS